MFEPSFSDEMRTRTTGVNKPQVAVAQLGARRHYAIPVLLHRAGMLAHFYTDAYVGPGSAWHLPARAGRLLPEAWRPASLKRLLGRREDSLPSDKITAFNFFGLRYVRSLTGAASLAEHEHILLDYSEDFAELVACHIFSNGGAIYAFQDAALPLFLKSHHLKILDRFSAPRIIEWQLWFDEYRAWEGWEDPYPGREVFQSRVKMERKEMELADLIVCGSEFVAQGVKSLGISPEKLQVISYGIEVSRWATPRQPWDGRRPLRLLFAGGVTLRKGVQYLYQALENLTGLPLSVRMVGAVAIQEPFRSFMSQKAELTGQVPRHDMRGHYGWADLFVFPSLCEGSAGVTYEALASGLPVITTPNAGSVVRDGIDGFIVPIRDAEAIATKIDLLAGAPELLAEMSHNARQRAEEFSWEKYGERLTGAIKQAFDPSRVSR